MKRLADRFAAQANDCSTLDGLGQLLDDSARELGFDMTGQTVEIAGICHDCLDVPKRNAGNAARHAH